VERKLQILLDIFARQSIDDFAVDADPIDARLVGMSVIREKVDAHKAVRLWLVERKQLDCVLADVERKVAEMKWRFIILILHALIKRKGE